MLISYIYIYFIIEISKLVTHLVTVNLNISCELFSFELFSKPILNKHQQISQIPMTYVKLIKSFNQCGGLPSFTQLILNKPTQNSPYTDGCVQ